MKELIGQQMAPLSHLLKSGGAVGWLIIALGVVLTVWGAINLMKRPAPVVLMLQAVCSLIPGVLAAAVAGAAYVEFMAVATGSEPAKPWEFAEVISRGLFAGTVGPLASMIPAALGIAGLVRASDGPENLAAEYRHE